jgi:hypothetical protein
MPDAPRLSVVLCRERKVIAVLYARGRHRPEAHLGSGAGFSPSDSCSTTVWYAWVTLVSTLVLISGQAKYLCPSRGEVWKIDDVELGGTGTDRASVTSLPSIKSLVRYIDENVAKKQARKK